MNKKGLGIFKKNKWLALKEIIERLVAEDPVLAFMLVFCILPIAVPLLNAVILNDLQQIFTIVITISGVTIGVIIPLLLIKTNKLNLTKQITETIAVNKRKFELHRDIELNKQKRYNELFDSKIESIKTETTLIRDSMEKQETLMMVETAQALTSSLRGNIEASNLINAEKYKESLKLVIQKLSQQSNQYDDVLVQLEKLDFNLKEISDTTKEIVTEQADSKLSSEQAVVTAPKPQLPKGAWICRHCENINSSRLMRCKKCNKSK